jgi:O-antigen ligase
MPEHLKALLVVLVLGTLVFRLSASSARELGIAASDSSRRRNIWILLTLTAFLAGGFWTYILIGAVVSWTAGRREHNPVALYVILLFAAPSFEKLIPGIGPIDHLFSIGHYRMLNLAVLLPAGLHLLANRQKAQRSKFTDRLVVLFVLLVSISHLFTDTASGSARAIFYAIVDILVPYFVVSRTLTSESKIVEALFSFLVSALICSLIAVFENTRFWLLYESLRGPFQIPGDPWVYLLRGEGVLRAKGSVGNSIALGYAIMVGLAALMALRVRVRSNWLTYLAIALLVGGLAATVSRGPWVGAVAAIAIMVALGPNLSRKFAASAIATCVAVVFFSFTPIGQRLSQYLPFVGGVETGSIDYRERLLDVSLDVMLQNPFFGDIYYISNPMMETMRQGQGIIDMVNTYLQVAMPYGLVGLFLFAVALLSAMWNSNKRRIETKDKASEALGRGVLAMMTGILVTIFTVSSITVIAPVYWVAVAVTVAFSRTNDEAPKQVVDTEVPVRTLRPVPQRQSSPSRIRRASTGILQKLK